MAEQGTGAPTPTGSTPQEPKVLQWLLLYTFGRLAIVAVLVGLLWVLGLPGFPGFLFGVLLAMPLAYLVLRPVRERLTTALVLRAEQKERLRVQLRGSDVDDGRR